ncbi:hypothetical protein BG003_002882 [Podila horticola]|nr:hypothetical protein BG003_002882 [Podila horticola]
MTSSSPSSAGLSPVGATFSEVSTPSSSPASPTFRSHPFASMAITELVISESQYVSTIKRVANALGQAAENAVTAGRKDSVTLRTLTDRWNNILRMHVKFHDGLYILVAFYVLLNLAVLSKHDFVLVLVDTMKTRNS